MRLALDNPGARHALALIVTLAAALLAWSPLAAQPQFPELNDSPVVDAAGIIDPASEAQLEAKLLDFTERNQRQFVVATVPSLDGYDISDYGYQLGRHWGIGDAERDDGIILLVAPNERRVRIETGYGLEAIIPDGLAYDIIEGDILPRFKAGDMTGGIVAGADAIIRQLELPPEEAAAIAAQAGSEPEKKSGIPFGAFIWLSFIFFFFILPILRGRGGRRYRSGVGGAIGNIILWEAGKAIARGSSGGGSSWGGGGGFSSGGGFSGGGGSFGGGGASGGW